VSRAAQHGDPFSVDLLTRAGRLVGATLATLVNFYNPSLIIIGGGEAVYRRSLPLATRNLRVMQSPLSDRAGLTGAAAMVVDELLSEDLLGRWSTTAPPSAGRSSPGPARPERDGTRAGRRRAPAVARRAGEPLASRSCPVARSRGGVRDDVAIRAGRGRNPRRR
jgi:hypothetical protein